MTRSPDALAPPPTTPRLRIDPTRAARTLLDGGWWPRSTDPLAELPGLVLAIDLLHGPVVRLILRADTWDGSPRRLSVAGRTVWLGYFTSQPATLLTAICRNDDRVDLLVVPPGTPVGLAEAAMALAATAGNLVRASQLLAAAAATLDARPASTERQTWEGEGGRLRTAPTAVASDRGGTAPARVSAPARPAPAPRRPTTDVSTITIEEQTMTVARHTIVAALRRRGQHARADWVERELPTEVETTRHTGLLATLRLDVAELGGPTAP
ncbi:DUF5994 family protein [Micromonospora sp. CPCC 205561]|uniref:DUF5994 family protein n=1 Tax=Micromonospora sp. CPCC 205561 TaxID=3122407 RepID=UPI002FEFF249